MVGNTVRVTRPSRSSPRSVKVNIRCEMPPIIRFNSLKRRGPPLSSMMTSTLHLSPTRARIEATPRQSLSRCALGGKTNPETDSLETDSLETGALEAGALEAGALEAGALEAGTSMCSGFTGVLGYKNVRSCGQFRWSLI